MPLDQADRIAFSLAQVTATAQIAAIATAKSQVQAQIAKTQALDTANDNLFIPTNALVNEYQAEFTDLDGNVRGTITEQDIQNSANKTFQNHFFPNDQNTTVPSLSATRNVWTQFNPFALTYAIGLGYSQTYPGTTTSEVNLINAILTLITSASANQDIENTTGEQCVTGFPDTIQSYPAVVTLKNNMVSAVNALVSFLNTELTHIPANDPNSGNQAQNNAATAYINTVILPALNTWLAYPDFNPVPGSVTTCVAFYSYSAASLAPTKLYSGDLAALQTALNNRLTFITTRVGQIASVLGSIVQSVSDGSITSSSGLYGKRYGFLALRLQLLTGSLISLNGLLNTTSAQSAIAASILENKNTYYSILPTSALQAPANSTTMITLVDVSFLSQGDVVYMMADNQQEMVVGIKSINGKSVVLTAAIPPQYSPSANGRLYKDLT